MENSDITLIKNSLTYIEKDNFKISDIAQVISIYFKNELKKENKSTDIESIKSRIRRTFHKNWSDLNLIVIGKDKNNGAKIYKKEDCDYNIFDFDSSKEKEIISENNSFLVRKLFNYVKFLEKLDKSNIGMASDPAIIFYLFSVLNGYLKERYEDFVFDKNMSELLKLISGTLDVPEFFLLEDLKSRDIQYSEFFDFSVIDDSLGIKNNLLKELHNDK